MSDPLDPRAIEAQDSRLAGAARISELDRRLGALERRLAGEPWHVVGDAGEPAFTNSWVNVTSPSTYPPARFHRDALGRVHVEGAVKLGTTTTSAFTLPAGYRPSHDLLFPAHHWDGSNTDGAALVKVSGAGLVIPIFAGAVVELWLTCSFRAAR